MRKLPVILLLLVATSSLLLINSQGATIGAKKTNKIKTIQGKQSGTPNVLRVPEASVPCTFQKPCITKLRFIDAPGYKVGRSQGPIHFTQDRINLEFETIPNLDSIRNEPNQQSWMMLFKFEEKSGNNWVNLITQETSVWKFGGARGSGWVYFFPSQAGNKINFAKNRQTDGRLKICVKGHTRDTLERCEEYDFTVPATARNAQEQARREAERRRQAQEAEAQRQADERAEAERVAEEQRRQAEAQRQREADRRAEEERRQAEAQAEQRAVPASIRSIQLSYLNEMKTFTSNPNAQGYHFIDEWITLPGGGGRRLYSVAPNEPYGLKFEIDNWHRDVRFYFACEYQQSCPKNPNLASNENTLSWVTLNPFQNVHVQMRQNRCNFGGTVRPYIYVCVANSLRSDAQRNLTFCTADSGARKKADQCWMLQLMHP